MRRNSTQTIVNTGLPTTKIDMTFVRQQKEIHARPRFSFLRLYNSGVSTIVDVSQMPVWRKWSNATSTRSRPDLILNYPNWDSGRWIEKIPQTGSWELARRMVEKKKSYDRSRLGWRKVSSFKNPSRRLVSHGLLVRLNGWYLRSESPGHARLHGRSTALTS